MEARQQKTDDISIGFLSYEFPPHTFGGVGVHVSELTMHLVESVGQVHVFTSHVEGLNDRKVGGVYVHRSPKPVVPASNRSSNAYKRLLSDFTMPGIVERHISSGKIGMVHPHGELNHVAATKMKKVSHLPRLMTTQCVASDKFDSGKLIGVMKQDVGDSYIAVSKPMQVESKQVFGVEALDGQKVESVYGQSSTELLVPKLNYSKKDYERIITNKNVAEMVNKYLLDSKLDLLHSHGGLIQMAATEAKMSTQLPLVMTAHSTEINRVRPDNLSILMEQNVMDMVDRFIAVSNSIRRELNRTFGIGYKNITVIPNGVNSAIFKHQDTGDICKKYQLDNRFIVLFVGRDDPQKGVVHLVKAVMDLARQIPEIMLVMVGQRDIYSDKHILCLPRVSRSELIKLYSLSDVFVLPSVYEPFGIVLLEAMACETPCIGFRIGGIPDIIDHDRTGLLVEPENYGGLSEAIARLYHDPEKCSKMGKNGRERVISCFDWNSISTKTIEVYRQVLH
ncbi:MAG: glycosyltransferase [Methanosarcinaceae archaeon]